MATQQSCCKQLSLSAPSCSARRLGIQAPANAGVIMICFLWWSVDRWAPTASHSHPQAHLRCLVQRSVWRFLTFNSGKHVCPLICLLSNPDETGGESSAEVMTNSGTGEGSVVCFLLPVCHRGRRKGVCLGAGQERKGCQGEWEGERKRKQERERKWRGSYSHKLTAAGWGAVSSRLPLKQNQLV